LEDVEVGCQGPFDNKKIQQLKDDFVKIWNSAKELEGIIVQNSFLTAKSKETEFKLLLAPSNK
jgi:hypothetical protein